MLIDWLRLVPALALLLTPIALFHHNRVRYRALMRDWDGYWGRTFGLGLHTIDLLRALLGVWLLSEAIRRAPEAQGVMRYAAVVAHAAILSLATVLQATVCKEPETAHAPFAFVVGLLFGYIPLQLAGVSLVLAIALARGANAPGGFFPVLALAAAGASTLFEGRKLLFESAVIGTAIIMPWMVTLLFPRHFVCSYRARKKTEVVPPLR